MAVAAEQMRTALQQLIVALIPALVVAVLTALLTVRLALRRFYSERWWERKAQAYSDLVQALYVAKRWPEEWLRTQRDKMPMDEAKADSLRLECLKGEETIRQATGIGTFVISAEATKHLEELQRELRDAWKDYHSDGLHRYVERQVKAFTKCLDAVRNCAKRDLRVS